jgi:uncharacterized membrane protein YbhN (UPF0104 family)
MVGWLGAVWHSFRSISVVFVVPALVLQTLQTSFAAVGWRGILRHAYPDGGVRTSRVLACYATGVALNDVLPANAGSLVTLLMLVGTTGGATLVGVLAASFVEEICFGAIAAAVIVYLLVADGGSLALPLDFVVQHPWATALAALASAAVVGVVLRYADRWLRRFWLKAKQGGTVLSNRRAYLTRVAAPQLLSWSCGFGVTAVLLTAYGVPVGFHTMMRVLGGNSVANFGAVTPGGIGVKQALSVYSLRDATSSATASAYSIGEQVLRTVWSIGFAVVLLAVAFGWRNSTRLVLQSYRSARQRLRKAK